MKTGRFKIFLLLPFLILMTACTAVAAAEPEPNGELRVEMLDYRFEPKVIRVTAGQEVTLVLINQGDKMHEFMAGREVQVHDGATEGFTEDFFAGILPEVSGPGMVMGMEGAPMEVMDMGGMDMGESGDMQMEGEGEHTDEESMDMGESGDMSMEGEGEGMDMDGSQDMQMEGEDDHAQGEAIQDTHDEGEMESMEGEHDQAEEGGGHTEGETPTDEHDEAGMESMDMGDEHQEGEEDQHTEGEGDEHDEEGAGGGEFGPIQAPLMDAHVGFMVMIDPLSLTPSGEVTYLTFTIPEDKVGTWTIGCFQEGGQHFDDGMRGTLIVEAP